MVVMGTERTERLPRSWSRQYVVRLAAQNAIWPLVLAGAMPAALQATSFSQWWWPASVCLILGGLYLWFGIPARYLVLPGWRLMFLVGVVVVLGAGLARPARLSGSFQAADAVPIILGLALAALRLYDRRRARSALGEESTLLWPLPRGRWTVAEGTGTVFNHHWVAPAQRGAIDLVGAVRGGRSTTALRPRACTDFAAYGAPVLAPCSGTVRSASDGHQDRPDPAAPVQGNHVVIVCGDGLEVMLAHLRRESIKVRPGDHVSRGAVIGAVGNSGNSSEPHLHIHALRGGRPVRLRFAGVRSALRRNAVIATTPGRRGARSTARSTSP
jgi:murein DD-endopeptidase MepM/ murein hydrolase activator NlpD